MRKKADKENTLNFWEDSDITFEEVAQLQRKINEVQSSLIKAVGSHPPLKLEKAEAYDLG